MAISPDEAFLEAVELVQGIRLKDGDFESVAELYAKSDQTYQRIRYDALNCDDAWIYTGDVDNGKILKIVASVALGFLSGGILGGALALVGALFGGGKKQRNRAERRKSRMKRNASIKTLV